MKDLDADSIRKNKGKWLKEDIDPKEMAKIEEKAFFKIISEELSEEEKKRILTVPKVYPNEETIMALHWHPEFIPMELIKKRFNKTFPNKKNYLMIPTQHNEILELDGYYGVEVDCFSKEFNRKVQLLLHFKDLDMEKAKVLRSMIEHSFKYRSKQLFALIDTIINPDKRDMLQEAIETTGVDDALVTFVKINTDRLNYFVQNNLKKIPPKARKNKLVRNYFDELRPYYGDRVIDLSQIFVKSVKKIMKRNFDYSYFYTTQQIIDEARKLNAGIIIPHPEQFWPILLADYDVDGYEVWNPQSWEYTDFLVRVLLKQNRKEKRDRPLLIFMGDDTHMGEKVKPVEIQKPDKANREIGYQPPWKEPDIQKNLIIAGYNKESIIEEYISRLEKKKEV